MSGVGDPDFTCTLDGMNDLFTNTFIGTDGDLWNSSMDAQIDCVPPTATWTPTAASLKQWYEEEGIGGSGYAADGAIFVNQISAGMDGMCVMLFMLKDMIFVKGYTGSQLRERTASVYGAIKSSLGDISFKGVSSAQVSFRDGQLDGGISILQTGQSTPGAPVDWVTLGKFEQGTLKLTVREFLWPDGTSGLANAPGDTFPTCSAGFVFALGACEPCPAGTYSEGEPTCTFCDLGKFGNQAC